MTNESVPIDEDKPVSQASPAGSLSVKPVLASKMHLRFCEKMHVLDYTIDLSKAKQAKVQTDSAGIGRIVGEDPTFWSEEEQQILQKVRQLADRVGRNVPKQAGPNVTFAAILRHYRDLQNMWEFCNRLPVNASEAMESLINLAFQSTGHCVSIVEPIQPKSSAPAWIPTVERVMLIDPRSSGFGAHTGMIGLGRKK
jgi:hypothetical protein